jgi:hypothetical protein
VLTPETAVRVAALCLDGKGRLSGRLVCSTAVRAALLVDLALAGRLEETADSIALDDSPTGVPPLDALLQAVTRTPGTTLDAWLELPRPNLRDLAEEALRSGRWVLQRGLFPGARFADRALERTAADRARDPQDAGPAWAPADAAVTAIAHAAGVRTATDQSWYGDVPAAAPGEALLAATGPLRWLCTAVTDHLAWARARDTTAALALRSSGTVGPG